MEDKIYIMTNFNKFTINKINNRINKLKKILYWFIFITFILNIGIISFLVINNFSNKKIILSELYNEILSEIKNGSYKRISNLQKNIKVNETTLLNTILNQSNENKPLYEKLAFNQQNKILDEDLIFNQTINDRYIKEQIYFCNNENSFYNKKFEDRIKLVEVYILYKRYNMYVYKELDYVSNSIISNRNWERTETRHLMKALEYYSNKTKIKYEDIYIIDIGANIGWYSIFFGKQGFKIISFEPSQLNNYILRKNFCLHKEINMTIINKGLYTEERKCDLFNIEQNKGNGLVICDHYNDSYRPIDLMKNKTGEIILTKLSNYIPFLSQKNVAMIKIDIEGSEARAITGGIELITKYHIPFIFLEFTPSLLKLQGNDPKEFLQLFVDNGYKISLYNFFYDYVSVEDILKSKAFLQNLYLVYSKILE